MATDITENEIQTLKYEVFIAARDGNSAKILDILSDLDKKHVVYEALDHHTEEGGQVATPLIIAARNGNETVVHVLLNIYRVDTEQTGTVTFNEEKRYKATALWCASAAGHIGIVKFLITHGAFVNHETIICSTPLRAACYGGFLNIVKYLVDNNADVTIANTWKNTCLMIACYRGHYNVAEYLIKRGANIHRMDKTGSTALHYSAEAGHFPMVKLLMDSGATSTKNDAKMTPLNIAAVKKEVDVVEYLISRSECSREQTIDGLELLGPSFADYDIVKSYRYLRKAVAQRYNKSQGDVIEKRLSQLVPAYNNWVERKTIRELREIENNCTALRMESLAIRERVLGHDHPMVAENVVYIGAVFADEKRYDMCISLWLYAL